MQIILQEEMEEKEVKNTTKEKGVPYGAREKSPLWFKAIWSTRGVSAGINAILIMQISYYCTDILGLNAAIIGTLFLVSKIIDAFTDIGFGFILDRTHTRWGKARPYEIFIVFEWLFTVLMFNAPKIGTIGQYIWIFIMYVLINAVCATVLGGIDSVYLAKVFTNQKNQISAISVNGFVVMMVSMIFSIVFPQFLATNGSTQAGWSEMSITLGIVLSIIGILRFVFCKEVENDNEKNENGEVKKTKELSLKESFKLLGKNQYLLIIVALMLLTFFVNNLSAATNYYFKYIVGDLGLQSIIGMTSLITVPALVLFPVLSRKIGTTKIMQGALAIGVIGLVIRTVGGTNHVTLMIGAIFTGIGTMPISMMINTYLIDCMDYGEWKTGTRIEGLVASIANFSSKVGQGIALGAVGFIMGLAGYNGMLEKQSAVVNGTIVFLYNILPLILYVIMFLLSTRYKVDSVRQQMDAELKEKHEKA